MSRHDTITVYIDVLAEIFTEFVKEKMIITIGFEDYFVINASIVNVVVRT